MCLIKVVVSYPQIIFTELATEQTERQWRAGTIGRTITATMRKAMKVKWAALAQRKMLSKNETSARARAHTLN